MKRTNFPIFITTLLISFSTLHSQEQLWQRDLNETLQTVGWIEQTNSGAILAAGDKGLLAMDNNTGEVLWHNPELKGLDKNTFQNIEGLPLFFVEYAPLMGKKRAVIINGADGKVQYDNGEGDFRFKTYHLIPDKGRIIFELSSPGDRNVMQFNLETLKSDWVASVGKAKGLANKLGNLAGTGFIDHGPIFGPNDELIVGMTDEIFAFNSSSGELLWKHQADKKIKALVYSDLNNSLYLGIKGSKKLTVFDPANGNDITPGKLKLKGTLIDIVDDGQGNLVLVETEGFNLIDPNNGELIWKKSYKIEDLDEVIPYKDGFIAVGKSEKGGTISLVSNDGDKIWDSKVKGYSYYVSPSDAGILYISTERANILEYTDGKDVWDKDVKFKSIPAVTFDEKENKVVLFENKKGYKFSLEDGKMDIFADEIELENVKKDTPLESEYVSSGYYIFTDQHTSVLDPSGKLLYSKYFEPVSTIGGLTNLASTTLAVTTGVQVDIQGSLDNLNTLKSISAGNMSGMEDQTDAGTKSSVLTGLYVSSGNSWSTIYEITKTRYYNSKLTQDYQYILTKLDDAGTKVNAVIQLNKSTGEIEKKVMLIDKTPNYIADGLDNRVFLNEKNRLITCFQM